jgi:succinate dehydrogenase hydrophobic anchor subunit
VCVHLCVRGCGWWWAVWCLFHLLGGREAANASRLFRSCFCTQTYFGLLRAVMLHACVGLRPTRTLHGEHFTTTPTKRMKLLVEDSMHVLLKCIRMQAANCCWARPTIALLSKQGCRPYSVSAVVCALWHLLQCMRRIWKQGCRSLVLLLFS